MAPIASKEAHVIVNFLHYLVVPGLMG
jgi:hypothetical protein